MPALYSFNIHAIIELRAVMSAEAMLRLALNVPQGGQ